MENKNYEQYALELFKEFYYHQIEQKDKINERISIPATIYLTLLGGSIYFITNYKDTPIYLIFLIIYIASLIVTGISFYTSYYNYKYECLSKPSEIKNYIDELKKYYEINYDNYFKKKDIVIDDYIIKRIRIYLIKLLSEITTVNIDSNLKKVKNLRTAGICLLVNGLFFIILFFLNLGL